LNLIRIFKYILNLLPSLVLTDSKLCDDEIANIKRILSAETSKIESDKIQIQKDNEITRHPNGRLVRRIGTVSDETRMNVEMIDRLIIARKYDIPIFLGHIRLTYSQLSCADNVILRISFSLSLSSSSLLFFSLSLSLSLSLTLSLYLAIKN